ncbi:MAG: hypothetical protein HYX53_15635 [Chloroflexi bacterium]|nr:hypothetical protein [Chloroflexota bacterium]
MKLLLLGNSNDMGDWTDGAPRRNDILRERLAEALGEPVEIVARSLWPTPRMPQVLKRWVDDTEPDMVYINVTSFTFSYESLPLRFRRIFGRLGPAAGEAGKRFAESKRWSHNAIFRTLRSWGQATIGGDTNFTCEQVIASVSEAIRVVYRKEHTVLMVKGPFGRSKTGITRREHLRKEKKRLQVHLALESLCAQLRVRYIGRETPEWREMSRPRELQAGDGLHLNAKGHAYMADELFDSIHAAWTAHLEETAAAPAR